MKTFAACAAFRNRIQISAQTVSAEFQRPSWKRYAFTFLHIIRLHNMRPIAIDVKWSVCLSVCVCLCVG